MDSFTRGYVQAALSDDLESCDATIADIAPETLNQIKADCAAFLEALGDNRAACIEDWQEEDAGRDFWYTRNGLAGGFADGDWPEPYADELLRAAEGFGEVTLWRGDDGKLYARFQAAMSRPTLGP